MSGVIKETKMNKFQEEPTGIKNATLVLQVDTMEKNGFQVTSGKDILF